MLDLDYRRIDMLAEATDVVIRIGPMLDSGLVARTLPPVELLLCASPGYLDARGIPRSLNDLLSHDIVEREQTAIWPFSTGDALRQIEVGARLTIPDAGAQKVVLIGEPESDGFPIIWRRRPSPLVI